MATKVIKTKNDSLKQRLGTDAKFPINGNFQKVEGLETLLQDIQLLLLTIPGERVGRPKYGCNLRNQIWENIDQAAINGQSSIKSALDTYEPRIKTTNISYTINRNTDLIIFRIKFIVTNTDVSANLVFPFRTSAEISFRK